MSGSHRSLLLPNKLQMFSLTLRISIEGIVRFDPIEYEVTEVGENNTYKLIFHGLEWTGAANEDFVIPTYNLTVRFERQTYTLEDNTVVQALVAVNLGEW